jgi:hypothetical protein
MTTKRIAFQRTSLIVALSLIFSPMSNLLPIAVRVYAQEDKANWKPKDVDQTPAGKTETQKLPNDGHRDITKNKKGEHILEEDYNGLGFKTRSRKILKVWPNGKVAEDETTVYGAPKNGQAGGVERVEKIQYDKDGQPDTKEVIKGKETKHYKYDPKGNNGKGDWIETSTTTNDASFGGASLVGVVIATDTRPGETCSCSLTTEPKRYENKPGLEVVEMQMNLARDDNGKPSLDGHYIDFGDGRRQPANKPVEVLVSNSSLHGVVYEENNQHPVATCDLPVTQPAHKTERTNGDGGGNNHTPTPADYQMPPVCTEGVQVCYGPFDGNAGNTEVTIEINHQPVPVPVITETPRESFCLFPDSATDPISRVVVHEGPVRVSFLTCALSLAMSAVKLQLMKGESTAFSAVVSGPEQWPDKVWRPGTPCSDLVDEAKLLQHAPGLQVRPGDSGAFVLLVIENASRETGTISPATNERAVLVLHKSDFARGPYTFKGVFKSFRAGGFVINGITAAFLAPVVGEAADPST